MADETVELSAAVVLRKEVAAAVAEQSKTEVRSRVVAQLVEAEIQKRAAALALALSKRQEAAKELDKIRPDIELDKIRPDIAHYDENGTLAVTAFSKAVFEQKKQAKAKLEKIDKAIDAAINNADYQALDKIGGKEKTEMVRKGQRSRSTSLKSSSCRVL